MHQSTKCQLKLDFKTCIKIRKKPFPLYSTFVAKNQQTQRKTLYLFNILQSRQKLGIIIKVKSSFKRIDDTNIWATFLMSTPIPFKKTNGYSLTPLDVRWLMWPHKNVPKNNCLVRATNLLLFMVKSTLNLTTNFETKNQ